MLTIVALLTPVVLQQLLASMKNPESPGRATITYAFISLILRLISAQSNVFNLWYQRRAYERSRGEMITMLYEKTLNRKILGAKQDSAEEKVNGHTDEGTNGVTNGEANGSHKSKKSWPRYLQSALQAFTARLRSLFGKKKAKDTKKEDSASMGKILNLMRYVTPIANPPCLWRFEIQYARYLNISKMGPLTTR